MLSSLVKKWRDRVQKTDTEALDASRAQIRAWQKVLAEEQGRLGHDLTELLATYERSLRYFSAHVADLDPASLEKERQSLEAIRGVLNNAVRRLEVSTKDDRELQDEWQEWQALLEASAEPLDVSQSQRREMVRSELAIRGKLPVETPLLRETAEETFQVKLSYPSAFLAERTTFVEESLDDLDDWHAIYSRELEAAEDHWQERLEEALTLSDRDPVYAAAVVARVRVWHGERKQFRKK